MIGVGNESHELPREVHHEDSDKFTIERNKRDGFTQENENIPGARLNKIGELGHVLRARYMAAGLQSTQKHSNEELTVEVIEYIVEKAVSGVFETTPPTEYTVTEPDQDSEESLSESPIPEFDEGNGKEGITVNNTSVEVTEQHAQSDVKMQKCVDLFAGRYQKVASETVSEIQEQGDALKDNLRRIEQGAADRSEQFELLVGHIVSPDEGLNGKTIVLIGEISKETASEIKHDVEEIGATVIDELDGNEDDVDIAVVGNNPSDENKRIVSETNSIDEVPVTHIDRMLTRIDSIAGEQLEVGEDIFQRQNPGQYGFAWPITTLVVKERRPVDETEEKIGERYYPLLPWYGALSCTCSRSHDGGTSDAPICEHMIHAITTVRDNETDIDGIGELPQRFKRFVHPSGEKTFRQEVIVDDK